MGFAPTTSKDKDTGKKVFTFSLRLPELIGLTTIILVGFIWVFIFGLLVGRGYQPEEALPELKHLMPSQQQVANGSPVPVEQNIGANTSSPTESSSIKRPLTSPQAQPAAKKPKEPVIEAVQLNFFEQLKAKETSNSPATASKPKKTYVVAKRPAPKLTPKPPKVIKQVKPVQSKPVTLEKNVAAFEYIYQVAASTDKKAASKLRNAISAKGFTTSLATAVIDAKKWYRINVHFVGTSGDLDRFKQRLAVAGYKQLLLKKKKQR